MSIVIIYGPQGTGKTTHAEALRRHYKCSRVVDGWPEDVRVLLRQGDLALTNTEPPFDVPGATVVDIETAMREAGLDLASRMVDECLANDAAYQSLPKA